MSPGSRRPHAALDSLLFGLAFVVLAAGAPLGLDRVASADAVTAGLVWPPGPAAGAPLAWLAARVFAYLPLGDLAARANLAAALLGAAAVAAFGRLGRELVVAVRPSPDAFSGRMHEAFATAAGALLVPAALGTFSSLTAAGPTAATLLVVGLGLVGCLRLANAPESTRLGLFVSFVAGACAGAEPLAAAVVWPPGTLLALWALRRGERWPLLGPLVFVSGLAFALCGAAVRAEGLAHRVFVAPFTLALGAGPAAAPWLDPSLREAAEHLGVVATLVALVGFGALVAAKPLAAALVALPLFAGGVATATRASSSVTSFALVLAAAGPLVAVGIVFLARRLAAARAPAAVVIAVVCLGGPALEGGAARWRRDGRAPARLLEAAHARSAPRATVTPGSPELQALMSYGAALGLRPDLRLVRAPVRTAE